MSYFNIMRNNFIEGYSDVFQDDEYYYLYKHFSYGEKDTPLEFKVLDTFHNCSLLFSKPNTFNDPFDCMSIVDYDFNRIKKSELEVILNFKMTNKYFKLNKDKYIRDLKSIEEVKNWGNYRRHGFHLTCFNNSPLHILMWSHYACNHQGFMVEFKFKKLMNDYSNLPIPVNYCNDFPRLKYPYNASTAMCIENKDFGAEVLIKLFSNKAECWSYENEFRLINLKEEIKNDKGPAPIENDLFVSVILGHLTRDNCIEETRKAVDLFNKNNNMNIEIYRAKMMSDKYEIYVPGHPRLDIK